MPARPTGTPFRLPSRLARLSGFPQCKILFVLFLLFFIGLLGLSLCLFNSLKLAVVKLLLICLNTKVDRAFRLIGIAILDNLFDEGDNFRHVFCHSGQVIGLLDPENLHVLEEIALPPAGKFEILDSLVPRVVYYFVFNIRDVHAELNYMQKVP